GRVQEGAPGRLGVLLAPGADHGINGRLPTYGIDSTASMASQLCRGKLTSQTPVAVAWLRALMRSSRRPPRQHLEVVRVVHDAQDVSKGIDDGSGDESHAALRVRLLLRRSHGQQLLESCFDVVDVPVHDGTGWAGR